MIYVLKTRFLTVIDVLFDIPHILEKIDKNR